MPLFACCTKKVQDVRILDYKHCGLSQVPNAVFNAERTLESLHLDCNQLKSLPRELFYCHGLRYLTISDNDIESIPTAISSLSNIELLDLSRNGILELPDNLKSLKYLSVFDVSVNPLGKLPEGFTQLLNLTQLSLNDCFLEYLPGNFGRLSKLKVLELRENRLKTIPHSLSRLTLLERLDLGCNELTELPGAVLAALSNLLEFWCDANQLTSIPKEIGELKQLMYFDGCKNRIGSLPDEISCCISLSDLHLSTNLLKTLPHSIGRLSSLTTFKVDDNQLETIPSSIGGLVSLSELDISANDLEEIPPTIGLLRHLRTLIADENFLSDIPNELGSCSGLTVLSVRSNKLTYLPDEIGRISRLRVLNLSDNEIKVLPYSLINLKELQALWLAENQSKALIRLQAAMDPMTQRRCLTCYLLPQQRMDPVDNYADDNQSFHPSVWEEERRQRQQIQFDVMSRADSAKDEASTYPKEIKENNRHVINEAIRKKNRQNGHLPQSTDSPETVTLGSAEMSPKTATHRLVKLEKEKIAKDKVRINQQDSTDSPDKGRSQNSHSNKPKNRKSRGQSHSMNDTQQANQSQQNSFDIEKTHSNDHSSRMSSNQQKGQAHEINSNRATENKGQGHDRHLTNQLKLQQKESTSRQSLNKNESAKTGSTNGSQALLQQEETFGVFVSEEDPKLYERRFKYYQRMRKHRKNTDIQSDFGYYHSGKTASDSGQRRRPLLQGRDGFDQWERYSQRSMGDGYASDVEAFNHQGGTRQPVSHLVHSQNRSASRKTLSESRTSVGENRPRVPPSYNVAVASRGELNNIENTHFPPPPPYKPPPREPGPDGQSNDGVPRSSPINESRLAEKDSVYKPYTDVNIPFSSHLTNTNGYLYNSSQSLVTSTPITSNSNMPYTYVPRSTSSYSRLGTSTVDSNKYGDVKTRDSLYQPNPEEQSTEHTDYVAQISKSLGRLGYSREQERKAVPHNQNYDGPGAEMVPPPALFCGKETMAFLEPNSRHENVTMNSQPFESPSVAAIPYTPSSRRSIYKADQSNYTKSAETSNPRSSCNGNADLANQNTYYGYLPPPNRKSPKLPHKDITLKGLEVEDAMPELEHEAAVSNCRRMTVEIMKNPGLGFSVAGGIGLQGNPYRPLDEGIFVTKIIQNGPASKLLVPGDKIIKVNDTSFAHMEHSEAVNILKNSPPKVTLCIERLIPTDL